MFTIGQKELLIELVDAEIQRRPDQRVPLTVLRQELVIEKQRHERARRMSADRNRQKRRTRRNQRGPLL